MENQEQKIRSWDDLIFENRNKSYGAYAIRKDYSNELLKGALTGVGILVSIFILAGLINNGSIITSTEKDDGPICILPPPTILPNEPQVVPQKRVRTAAANLIPVASTDPDPIEQKPEQTTTSSGTEGTPDGTVTETGNTGAVDTGSGLVAPPVKNNQPFVAVEVMPVYKGGMEGMIKTLKKNMRYPASARRMGKEGIVYVEFVVSDEGEIKDVKVLRGFDFDCDKEAVRIVEKLTEWSPGMQNNMMVNVKMVLPVKFKLEQ